MKKIFAYLGCTIATLVMCWCLLFSLTTEPYTKERMLYSIGWGVSFIVALVLAGYGDSLSWKKESK